MSDRSLRVAVTFGAFDAQWLSTALGPEVEATVVAGLPDDERRAALSRADAIFTWNWPREMRPGEGRGLPARLVQLMSAGADHIPFDQLPAGATVAGNVGAYAEPMAEHVLAMILCIYKQLRRHHDELSRGVWNQQEPTRSLRGARCLVVGYGGIGRATATLLRAFGASIHALNTSGRTDDPVELVGTLDQLDQALAAADVVVLSLPLTRRTRRLIGAHELAQMKPTATLVNVARGAIVDEDALYRHLVTHPDFTAAIDTWWVEPRHGDGFRIDHPFFDLPNVLGSPHNSGIVAGITEVAAARAAANIRRFARGEPLTGVVHQHDYVDA